MIVFCIGCIWKTQFTVHGENEQKLKLWEHISVLYLYDVPGQSTGLDLRPIWRAVIIYDLPYGWLQTALKVEVLWDVC